MVIYNIKVSIIMPVYNSQQYLEDCINSILEQKFEDFELLLIDDGSSDNSPSICDKYAQMDSRVKVYHKLNEGICAARNYGLEKANGKYIAFSDNDDYVKPGFLKDNFDLAEQCNADIVKFGRKSIILQGERIKHSDIRRFKSEVLTKNDISSRFSYLRFEGAMTCVWDGMFKSEFLKRNNLQFNTDYKMGGEDIEFCSLCMINADSIVFNSGVYYDHYIRVGLSTSTKKDIHLKSRLSKLKNNYFECCKLIYGEKYSPSEIDFLVVMKNYLYPILVELIKSGEDKRDIIFFLEQSSNELINMDVHHIKLLLIDKKWALFGILFLKKRYSLLIRLIEAYKCGC